MQRGVLFIIRDDPRVSPRPAEAVRITAGIGAWRQLGLTLYLHGPGILALSEFPDTLIDGDNFSRYLPIVAGLGRPILVEKGAAEVGLLGTPSCAFEEISPAQLARLAGESHSVACF